MTTGQKLTAVVSTIAGVIIVYLLMALFTPTITSLVHTANITMAATSNLTNYPGTQAAVVGYPWFVWLIPGPVGLIGIAIILKS